MMDIKKCEEKTDEELVELTLKDQDYLLCLIEKYESKLQNYIMRISNTSREDAEDILQEVFIKMYRNLNDFDKDLKFSSWIYRITHNQVVSNYRKIRARPKSIALDIDSNVLENLVSDSNIEKEVDLKFLQGSVSRVLESLDPKYREVLVLKFLEEKDYKEISDILKKPMGTVATLINRAKKQFKEKLKDKII